MKVKNINGISDSPKCPCGDWLKHWEEHIGRRAGLCCEHSCRNSAEVGTLVQKDNGKDTWFVVPLCREHDSRHGEELEITNEIKLIPMAARSKCIKPNRVKQQPPPNPWV
jgi:hypothetical protein